MRWEEREVNKLIEIDFFVNQKKIKKGPKFKFNLVKSVQK
jgi:hypothetical protein